jgi:chromosome segregation ATPase
MATPRRRIIRPEVLQPVDSRIRRRLQKLKANHVREEAALARWRTRLRRAFNAVAKVQRTLLRIERQIAQLEEQQRCPE